MNLTLGQILALVKDARALYAEYQAAQKDGKVSTAEVLTLVGKAFALLEQHNITLADLRAIVNEAGPLLQLFG